MNDSLITPETSDELRDLVVRKRSLLAVGNRTKPTLSAGLDTMLVSLRRIAGIVEYQPSEFTFTARAGTTLAEIAAALADKRQYLPFDPLLVDAGATIGGTVAAGLSGPGRFRYGGIRDFLLGVRFISGDGQVINAGGKVVKNAAGFDIPKFLVGSMGRFGVMTELTFKVFPQPIATQTLRIECESLAAALERMAIAAKSRWEIDAIDYRPGNAAIYLRIAGPPRANASIVDEIKSTWGSDVDALSGADEFWRSVRELNWSAGKNAAAKVPTTPRRMSEVYDSLSQDSALEMHLSVAGNVIWMLLDDGESLSALDARLETLGMPGIVIRGESDQPRIGAWDSFEIGSAVQAAIDPQGKFPVFQPHRYQHS